MTAMPDPDQTFVGPGREAQQHVVTSADQAADLAAWLLSPHRNRVAVVATGALPDLRELARNLGEGVETYVVPGERATRALNALLPAHLGIAGDAVRVFSPGTSATTPSGEAALITYHGSIDDLAEQLITRTAHARSRGRGGPSHRPEQGAREPADAPFAEADGAVHPITTVSAGEQLARFLLDDQRRAPVVAVSIHPDATGPYFDAEAIASELKGVAEVVLIDADATYGLTHGFGDRQLSVFLGAARVYPVGRHWTRDMYAAPLYLCLSPRQARRRTPDLIAAALNSASAAGLLTAQSPPPGAEHLTVTVAGTLSSHHVRVRTRDGRSAAMLVAKLAVGVEPQRLVGAKLTGSYLDTGKFLGEFTPDPVDDEPLRRAQTAFPDGTATLARVTDVQADGGRALLHPAVPLTILADEDLSMVLSAGDTVGVEIVWEDDTALGALLADPAAEELSPALGIVGDSPPWLLPEDLAPEPPPELPTAPTAAGQPVPAPPGERAEGRTQPATSAGAPAGVAGGESDAAARQVRTNYDATIMLTDQVEQLQAKLEQSEATVRELKRQLRRATARRARSAAVVWRDPERQLRHDIDEVYLHRIPEDDRAAWPMPEHYEIGPRFVESIDRLQGISRDKILDVIVEVLTGLDKHLASRERHPWLTSRGGSQEDRPDGSRAWRVSLQSNTPGARRLKYWTTPQGIELDSVGHHDDGIRPS